MEEESSRISRFKRTSRFRKAKAMPDVEPPRSDEGESVVAEASTSVPSTDAPVGEEAPPASLEAIPAPAAEITYTNALTVDVKEWFQTEAFQGIIKFSHWGKYERRVERGIHLILALLRQYNVKATFFVLGIVAREFPELVKLLKQEGHEIGTCGYYNRLLYSIPPADYITEIEMSLSLLKSLTGEDIILHRAPGWSVTSKTLWILDVLKTYKITYDSSIYPVDAPLYGIADAPRFPYIIHPQGIIEFPPSTYNFMGKNIALFGGTYLRLLPYNLISRGVHNINRGGHPVMVHISPWEIEAEFPRIDLGWEGYLAQYAGIKTTFSKVSRLLADYKFDTMTNVLKEYKTIDSTHVTVLQKKG